MIIKILGSGCPSCQKLEENVKEAINEVSENIEIQKIRKIDEIVAEGIIRTPGLIINSIIKSQGKVPKKENIVEWIQEELEGSGQ